MGQNCVTSGAYVPLVNEGNIVVDGVLASCYGSFNHDVAHIIMAPMRWFPGTMECDPGKRGWLCLSQLFHRFGEYPFTFWPVIFKQQIYWNNEVVHRISSLVFVQAEIGHM